jgi:transposase InsO family protein
VKFGFITKHRGIWPAEWLFEALGVSRGGFYDNRKWIAEFTYVWTAERWLYVAAVVDLFSRRVVGWYERGDDGTARHRCAGDGDLATGQARCAAASLRSRQLIHQRAVPATDGRSRRCLFDEPFRQRSVQSPQFALFTSWAYDGLGSN